MPFGSNRYQIAVAPPLRTSQTSANVSFDQKQEVISSPFLLAHIKADTNRQLGMLSSVWANWQNSQVTKLAHMITMQAKTSLDKVRAVYNWEAANIAYNFPEVSTVENYRWSTTQETLATHEGICVDYSNVADALLRAVGIPTQMVVGSANDVGLAVADNGNVLHSWNRSCINGHWVYFDPTWSRIYLSQTQFVTGDQWFNPPTSLLDRTHHMMGIVMQ